MGYILLDEALDAYPKTGKPPIRGSFTGTIRWQQRRTFLEWVKPQANDGDLHEPIDKWDTRESKVRNYE